MGESTKNILVKSTIKSLLINVDLAEEFIGFIIHWTSHTYTNCSNVFFTRTLDRYKFCNDIIMFLRNTESVLDFQSVTLFIQLTSLLKINKVIN